MLSIKKVTVQYHFHVCLILVQNRLITYTNSFTRILADGV